MTNKAFLRRITAVSGLSLCVFSCQSGQPPAGVSPKVRDGTVSVSSLAVPPSVYMSEEARAALKKVLSQPAILDPKADIATQRTALDREYFLPLSKRAQALYPVDIQQVSIGGVPVAMVTPKEAIPQSNRERILLNLHGGSFSMGAGLGGLVESIPIAGTARMRVLSVDYREGPENHHPAASEDVAAVYRELLKHHKPENIGIYGCSSGGVLAAMSVAWFQKEHLPRPGAIGIFCAPAGEVWGGDSVFVAPVLSGEAPPPPLPNPPPDPKEYFRGVDLRDPLISPLLFPQVLRQFPPTLLITSTRDQAFSGAAHTQIRLSALGVQAELRVWDGMWHGFFYNPDLPESKEVYAAVAEFFTRTLAQ